MWLHAPCECCGKGRRRRKGCFVLRRSHLAAAIGLSAGLVIFLVGPGRWLEVETLERLKGPKVVEGAEEVDEDEDETTVAPTVGPLWKRLAIDWQETELGPGFPNKIDSAWTDVGILESGDVLRIEADGFNSKESPIAVWGWYVNIWNGDGRHWVTRKGDEEPSRLLHFNPRPRGGGYIAINNFLKGSGWGKEKDLPIPEPWRMENANKPFVLEVELRDENWLVKLKGEQEISYKREGDYSGPLVLQVYDLLNPKISLKKIYGREKCAFDHEQIMGMGHCLLHVFQQGKAGVAQLLQQRRGCRACLRERLLTGDTWLAQCLGPADKLNDIY